MSKYIVENGRVRLNPQYGRPEKSTVANPARAMVASYSVDDANSLAEATAGELAPSTLSTVVAVQDPQYVSQFKAGGRVDGGELLEQVSGLFTGLQAPIGLSHKLIGLQGFAINVKLDDSGSMGTVCSNRLTRWQNVQQRLLQLMSLLQVVPTRAVTLSFLDRRDVITLSRQGQTPQEFFSQAAQQIQRAFHFPPRGGTPIYANVVQMLQSAQGPTAHYLFTDGQPSDSRYSPEQEIGLTKDALLGRWNPMQNPFTFLCCSDSPTDTLWMHEVEEIACRPGALGFVSALQNFGAEQLEVLNDQGPEFPYSEAVWTLCCLTAALNPNDLDALDQHAPLSKPTLDNLLGHVTTAGDYESYFTQHPNACWLFAEEYGQFLQAEVTSRIPAVNFFETRLAQELNADINRSDDSSEPRAIARTEEAFLRQFNRQRPDALRRGRQDFWYNHCLRMEQMQAQYAARHGQARQDLWGDYVAGSGLGPMWHGFVQQCRSMRQTMHAPAQPQPASAQAPPPYWMAVQSGQSGQQQQQQQQQPQQQQRPQQQPQQQQQPVYHQYAAPTYYQGQIAPVGYR